MKILIAPAKKMEVPETIYLDTTTPRFEKEAGELRSLLYKKTPAELQELYKCSTKTMQPVYDQLCLQKSGRGLKGPALLCYQGLAFRSMAPDVFDDAQWQYVQKHLRILSGMYGVLRPMDAIMPYRLEMQNKPGFSLYGFWKDKIADALEDDVLINLASKEYAKAVTPYRSVIDVRFFDEDENGRRREPGAYAKMARGRMVRWMAENNITAPEQLQTFDELRYRFDPAASDSHTYVFYRKSQTP